MKNIKITALILSSFFVWACEETVNDVELPYVEQLVVTGMLEAGKPVRDIRVTKTYPPLSDIGNYPVYIREAAVSIESEGKTYTLYYDTQFNGDYYRSDEFLPEAGKKYKLTVKWNGMTAWAETTIPEISGIDFIEKKTKRSEWDFYYWTVSYYAYLKPEAYCAYSGAIADNPAGLFNFSRYYGGVYRRQDTLNTGYLRIPFYEIMTSDTNNIELDGYKKPCAVVENYDKAYYDYYLSRGNGDEFDGIFSMSGQNVKWNVRGDGIGLFIGKSLSVKEFKF